MEFRESDGQERMQFPANLTNTERKFVHEIAGQLGLKSKSTGKGESRCIGITKLNPSARKKGEDEDLPELRVGKQGLAVLRKHIQKFPPTHAEDLESHETGASIMEAIGGEDADVASRLQQLGLMNDNSHKEAARGERVEKPVNLQRRRQCHEAAQKAKKSHPEYQRMMKVRAQLPAFNHQEEIVRAVAENPITIISGDTGCGKVRIDKCLSV